MSRTTFELARDGVGLLRMDRPDALNAIDTAMLDEMVGHLEGAREDPSVRVVVISSTDHTAFSAGADLDEAKAGLALSPEWERLSGRVASLSCLTIAALNGTLAGGAFGMALACDLRIAVPEARFFYPVMRLGFLPQRSDPFRLARLVGPARAKMILMAGQRIEAPEALAWGLIDRIVPPTDLMDAARALAGDALSAAPDHVAAIKAMVV